MFVRQQLIGWGATLLKFDLSGFRPADSVYYKVYARQLQWLDELKKGEELIQYVRKKRLPSYSKDGQIPTDQIVKLFLPKDLIPSRLKEIKQLLDKKDISNSLCESVDSFLLSTGKPQCYGTITRSEGRKHFLAEPHDDLKAIAERREKAGLVTIEKMIEKKETSEKH